MFQTDFLVIVLNTHSSFFGGGRKWSIVLKMRDITEPNLWTFIEKTMIKIVHCRETGVTNQSTHFC